MFVMKRCLQWSMGEKELVTDTVTLRRKNAIDGAEFLKCYYLFLFQLLYQSQRTVNWWCGYPSTFIHTFIGPGILVYSIILSLLKFISVPNGILGRIYSFHFFHFLSLSFLYCLVSYLFTHIVLLSFYFFQKLDLFVMAIIRMYQPCFSEPGTDFVRLPRICILYTSQPILFVKNCRVKGRGAKGVLG